MVGRALVVLALVVVAVAVGCFSLSFANGSIKCSDDPARPCPTGYACVNDRCWLRSSLLFDGGSD